MRDRLQAAFPRLRGTPFQITSPSDPGYNCIAWAAGSMSDWWWPLDESRKAFWPDTVPRTRTLDAFRAVFATLGYAVCSDDLVENGFEKVAIFVDLVGVPTHAARQLARGRWTSKLGQMHDIEHDLLALEGEIYGEVGLILRRQRTIA